MPNQRRSLHRWSWLIVAMALGIAALLLEWRLASAGAIAAATAWPSAGSTVATAPRASSGAISLRPSTAVAARIDAIPGGLTPDQWQTLQQRVEPGPLHDRELARIVDFLEFQRRVVSLRESRGDAQAAGKRRLLASQIDAGIAAHLALHEISGAEAMLLKTAVLDETEPDVARRAQRLTDWALAWTHQHPPEDDPRVAEYQRQEAAAVAAWQSGPMSQRDPARLARQLQQLQSAVFDPQP